MKHQVINVAESRCFCDALSQYCGFVFLSPCDFSSRNCGNTSSRKLHDLLFAGATVRLMACIQLIFLLQPSMSFSCHHLTKSHCRHAAIFWPWRSLLYECVVYIFLSRLWFLLWGQAKVQGRSHELCKLFFFSPLRSEASPEAIEWDVPFFMWRNWQWRHACTFLVLTCDIGCLVQL